MNALEAALAVAHEHGLPTGEAVVLHHGHSVVVHLRPAPVVARIAITGAVLGESAGHALAVAAHAAARGAPVTAPAAAVHPGPHERGGVTVSFWGYVAAAGTVDARAAGAALRRFHDAVADAPLELPTYDPRDDVSYVASLVGGPVAELLLAAVERIALPQVPLRPLHGDAHLGNVIPTATGPVWTDLEGPRAGPVEWDLALLSHRSVLWRDQRAETAAALAGYGAHDADLVADLTGPVGVWLAALSALAPSDDPSAQARSEARRAWVRRRYGL